MDRGLDHGHARIPGAHRRGPRRSEYEVRDDAARALPARVFADDELLAAIARDRSLEQLVNVTALPGLVGPVYGMPDMHEGYGFPVGGVAATALPDGVISPGGIGFDINCGVRLLAARAGWATRCAAITCARWTRPTRATGSIDLPDRQLACVPLSAPEGRR
jgi:RNA-splicing ligase RtcB